MGEAQEPWGAVTATNRPLGGARLSVEDRGDVKNPHPASPRPHSLHWPEYAEDL
jgi:hypothetical protein